MLDGDLDAEVRDYSRQLLTTIAHGITIPPENMRMGGENATDSTKAWVNSATSAVTRRPLRLKAFLQGRLARLAPTDAKTSAHLVFSN
jgi:hypothetical protein